MKKLDWYILRKYLETFLFIILLLNCISVVIDISEKIDNFLDPACTLKIIVFDYYLYFIPYISAILAPFFALVAVIFFTSQLADRSEIIAILNSGTSFYRFLVPYMVGAFLISGTLYYGANYFIPKANKYRINFENTFVNKYSANMSFNFHRQVSPGVFVYLENYKPSDSLGYRFSMDQFKKGELVYKLRSDKIEWLRDKHKWRVTNYYARTLNPNGDIISSGQTLDTVYPFTPENFTGSDNIKEILTTPELKVQIDKMYKAGASFIEFWEVEKYRRSAIPFSIFIMTLIGVAVASQKVRGGLGWHLVLGLAISSLYEIIMKFSVTFSTNATLPPMVGVWIPNIIFGIVAIFLLRRAPK